MYKHEPTSHTSCSTGPERKVLSKNKASHLGLSLSTRSHSGPVTLPTGLVRHHYSWVSWTHTLTMHCKVSFWPGHSAHHSSEASYLYQSILDALQGLISAWSLYPPFRWGFISLSEHPGRTDSTITTKQCACIVDTKCEICTPPKGVLYCAGPLSQMVTYCHLSILGLWAVFSSPRGDPWGHIWKEGVSESETRTGESVETCVMSCFQQP